MRSQQKSRRSCSNSQVEGARREARNANESQPHRGGGARRAVTSLSAEMPAKADKWILLNVGGSYFLTGQPTLNRLTAPNSPLYCMANNSTNIPFDRDDRDAYIIDRDPAYFRVVLNFLRHGHLLLTRDTTEEGVLIEARYFNIPELARILEQRIQERLMPPIIDYALSSSSGSASVSSSSLAAAAAAAAAAKVLATTAGQTSTTTSTAAAAATTSASTLTRNHQNLQNHLHNLQANQRFPQPDLLRIGSLW